MTRTTLLASEARADVQPERGTASAVRAAVQSLFARLGAGAAPGEPERLSAPAALPPAERARREAERARRARAHAVFATVEGGGAPALDLAVEGFADEIGRLERRVDRQAEALKAIQLYAPDAWVRRIAQQALIDDSSPLVLPEFLIEADDDRIPLEAYRFIG